MGFQHHLIRSAGLASVSACLWFRFVQGSILTAVSVFFLFFWLQIISIVTFNAFIYPRYSPLRHLPTAPQRPLRQRFFKEPNPFQFSRWMNEVPNDGLIRYFGFLNTERVLIANPEAARQVMQVHTYDFKKPQQVSLHLGRFTGKGLAWQEGEGHKFHRSVMDVAFQHKNIKALHPIVWSKAVELTDAMCDYVYSRMDSQSIGLTEKSSAGAAVDIKTFIDHAVFDIIGIALHGQDFKAIANPSLHYAEYQDFLESVEPSPSHRNRMIASFVLPGWLVNMLPLDNNKMAAAPMAAFRKLGREMITLKNSEKAVKTATPEVVATMIEDGRFSEDQMLNEYLTIQTAGLHPTSSAILSSIWWLSQPKYHHVQWKLRQEIQKVKPDGTSDRAFEQMPYLDAVMNEVLRLSSVFTHTGRVPLREIEICGTTMPVGLTLSHSPYSLHRSTAIWGPDAAEFRPERWLNGEAATQDKNNFQAFGTSPRYCLGEKLARAEMRCFITAMLSRLDFSFPEGTPVPQVTHQVTLAYKNRVEPVARIIE